MQKQREKLLLFGQHKWHNFYRKEWLTQGDRNSRFFHQRMNHRSSKNLIYRLKNDLNMWEDDPQIIKSMLINSSTTRFASYYSEPRNLGLSFIPDMLTESEKQDLLTPFSTEEIKNVLFEMNPNKSPGSDGFGPKFFQAYWPIIGNEITTVIKSFFDHGQIPPALNHTIIALIPKIEAPENPNHFRPISLCNTIYKAISKLLVNRLRPILQEHISPFQNAFTPERSIHDNLLIVQEILNIFQKSKSKTGWCALKLDMEKAYDRIE